MQTFWMACQPWPGPEHSLGWSQWHRLSMSAEVERSQNFSNIQHHIDLRLESTGTE